MVYFVIRYSRKKNPHPTNIEGNVPLEITWTVVPLLLFMGIFYMGWRGYLSELKVPESAVPIKVTAQMWKWTFEYPNGVQTDTLLCSDEYSDQMYSPFDGRQPFVLYSVLSKLKKMSFPIVKMSCGLKRSENLRMT